MSIHFDGYYSSMSVFPDIQIKQYILTHFSNISQKFPVLSSKTTINQQALEEDTEHIYYHESGIDELICLLQNLPRFFWELYDQH